MSDTAGYDQRPVRKVFDADLGKFFRDLRLARGWGLRQAVRIAEGRNLTLITKNSLGDFERGKIKNPDPELLKSLSMLHEMPYEELIGLFVQRRFGLTVQAWSATENPKPDQVKTLAAHQENAEESASPRTAGVYEDRTQEGEGSHDHVVGTGAAGAAPTSRRPDIHERARLANELTKYAEALERADAIRNLYAAAAALLGGQDGTAGAGRTGPTPRAGGAGGRHARRGQS